MAPNRRGQHCRQASSFHDGQRQQQQQLGCSRVRYTIGQQYNEAPQAQANLLLQQVASIQHERLSPIVCNSSQRLRNAPHPHDHQLNHQQQHDPMTMKVSLTTKTTDNGGQPTSLAKLRQRAPKLIVPSSSSSSSSLCFQRPHQQTRWISHKQPKLAWALLVLVAVAQLALLGTHNGCLVAAEAAAAAAGEQQQQVASSSDGRQVLAEAAPVVALPTVGGSATAESSSATVLSAAGSSSDSTLKSKSSDQASPSPFSQPPPSTSSSSGTSGNSATAAATSSSSSVQPSASLVGGAESSEPKQQVGGVETLIAAESARESERHSAQAEAANQQQQQLIEEVPAVSGLNGQDELGGPTTASSSSNSNQETLSSATQTSTQASNGGGGQVVFQQSFEQQSISDQQQQSDSANSGSSTESSLRLGLNDLNDVGQAGEQLGRKSANEQSGEFALSQQQQQQLQASQGSQKSKVRSLKRAFGGHMFGVFGRKRANTGSGGLDQVSGGGNSAFSGEEFQQQQVGFEQPATARPLAGPNHQTRSHHYYYLAQQLPSVHEQIAASAELATTQRPLTAPTTKAQTKLKEADFPDYREILIQPDNDNLQQQQMFEAHQNQELARTTTSNKQHQQQAADITEQQQQQQQIHVQVNENEFVTEQPEAAKPIQQQVTESAGVLSNPATFDSGGQQTIVQQTSNSDNEQLGGSKIVAQDGGGASPFIRLSNIATINSSSSDSSSGSSSNSTGGGGGVKLMRIYVIDLDQKLVVGGAGHGSDAVKFDSGAGSSQSVQYPVDSSSAATPTQQQASSSSSSSEGNVTWAHGGEQQHQHQQQHADDQLTSQQLDHEHHIQKQQQQQHRQEALVPEGYVLLDRESLQSNLSQMFSNLGPQYSGSNQYPQEHQSSAVGLATLAANYTNLGAHPSEQPALASAARAHHSSQQHQAVHQPPPPSTYHNHNPNHHHQQQQQYTDTPPLGSGNSSLQAAAGYPTASAQLSGNFTGFTSPHHQPMGYHGPAAGSNYTQVTSYDQYQGFYPSSLSYGAQAPEQHQQQHIVAIYPEPLAQHQMHQYQHNHHHQHQVYQSVPQYIAPQYAPSSGGQPQQAAPAPGGGGYHGGFDGANGQAVASAGDQHWSQTHSPHPPVGYQQQQQQQQPQPYASGEVAYNNNNYNNSPTTSHLSTLYPPAPGAHLNPPPVHGSQDHHQVRYNGSSSNNNYTSSKAAHFVQAPLAAPRQQQQQDKHHANGTNNHLNVYHRQQQQQQELPTTPAGLMYQQQQQVVLLDPTPVFSAQAHSAQAAASAYTASLRGEPAQQQPQPQMYYNNNNGKANNGGGEPSSFSLPAHKVTTAAAQASQNWKPVDYPASSAYSQTAHYQPNSSIDPAQYTNNNNNNNIVPPINGYRDHDVVSLAGQQQQQQQHLRPKQMVVEEPLQVDLVPGQIEIVESSGPASAKFNHSAAPPPMASASHDVHHAPVNYGQQPRKSSYPGNAAGHQQHQQVGAYVNTQTTVGNGDDEPLLLPASGHPNGAHDHQHQHQHQIVVEPQGSHYSHSQGHGQAASSQQVGLLDQHQQQQQANNSSHHPSFERPTQMGQSGGAPAHQHQQQLNNYNGTGIQTGLAHDSGRAWPATGDQAANNNSSYDYNGGQASPKNANEYPSQKAMLKQSNYGAASSEQYGSNPLAAYGKQGEQQKQLIGSNNQSIKPMLLADQSLIHETQGIPQYGQAMATSGSQVEANYNQEAKQTSPYASYKAPSSPASAYLAVNGPPISDGVYSSEEPVIPKQAGRPTQHRYRKPAHSGQPTRPHQPKRPGGSSKYKQASSGGQENVYASQQQQEFYQSEQAIGNNNDHQQAQDEYNNPTGSAQYGTSFGQQGYQQQQQQYNYPQQAHIYQRPPMVAVANYYRAPPGGSKGLLSWETLQSVASGAAKRLPSLSSILMPFAGASKTGLYPTANYHYQQQQQVPYPKSVHFDRDVSNFHRPYPLRHMSPQQQSAVSVYRENASEQSQEASAEMQQEAGGGDYGADLSQASSSDPAATGAEDSSVGGESGDSVGEAGHSVQKGATGSTKQLPANLTNLLTNLGLEDAGEPAGQDVGKQNAAAEGVEFAPDSENTPPAATGSKVVGGNRVRPAPVGQPKGRKPVGVTGGGAAIEANTKLSHGEQQQLEPAQVAAISSIEQQLSAGAASGNHHQKPKRKQQLAHKQRAKMGSSALLTSGASNPAPASTSDFLEPTILAEHDQNGNGVPLESLPADQQRLLMGSSKRPLGSGSSSSNIMFPSSDTHSDYLPPPMVSGGGGGSERPLRPMVTIGGRPPMNSVQIGQFKIIPQTQFVQSIIEPSRQMFGQYFKQYIGQLGQTLG